MRCNGNIDDFMNMLRSLVECTPGEWYKICRKFQAFVVLDNGVSQIQEPKLGITNHSLSQYDYMRDKNDVVPHPVLAVMCELIGKAEYRISLYAMDIYDPENEHKYLGCDNCKKRSRNAVIDDMRIALISLLEFMPNVCKVSSDGCKDVYTTIENLPSDATDCCHLIPKFNYNMNENVPDNPWCYVGVAATFNYKVELECMNYAFECKDK